MSSCKSLHNRESDFVESVSQFVNFVSEVVVGNNSQRTSQDTESHVNQSFGNTFMTKP